MTRIGRMAGWTVGVLVIAGAVGARGPLRAAEGSGQADRIATISRGAEIRLEDWKVPGKVTIFDFFSKSCPPCMMIKGPLRQAVAGDPSVNLRIVDIDRPGTPGIDWGSPVARQFEITGIPYFIIFDANGREHARGEEATEEVVHWLRRVGLWE